MWTLGFWQQTAERAIKTFAQVLILLLGGGETGLNLLAVDWKTALISAAGSAVLSVLTSLVSSAVTPTNSPSLVSLASGGRHEK